MKNILTTTSLLISFLLFMSINAYAGTITIKNDTGITLQNLYMTMDNGVPLIPPNSNPNFIEPATIQANSSLEFTVSPTVGQGKDFTSLSIVFSTGTSTAPVWYKYDVSNLNTFSGDFGLPKNTYYAMYPGTDTDLTFDLVGFAPTLDPTKGYVIQDQTKIIMNLSALSSTGKVNGFRSASINKTAGKVNGFKSASINKTT